MADGSRILTLALACLLTTVGFVTAASAQGPVERIGDLDLVDLDDCQQHPPIEVTEDEGANGFIVADTPVGPIYRPGSGVLAGSGTANDPYVIEGWCIQPYTTSEAGIRIANTDSHVVVQDNRVTDDFDTGISVENAAHVTIDANHVENNGQGLTVEDSSSVYVEGNLLDRNGERSEGNGVTITGSASVELVLNRIADNAQKGVETEASDALTFRGNLMVGHGFDGLDVDEATGVEIRENTLIDNEFTGLALDDSSQVQIVDNKIVDNGEVLAGVPTGTGVDLRESSSIDLRENRIADNLDTGVALLRTSDVGFLRNNVTANGDGIEVQQAQGTLARENSIHDNEVGLDVDDASDRVDARVNWWGDALGPSGGVEDACEDALADGDGDRITTDGAGVCFARWLSDPNPDVGLDE